MTLRARRALAAAGALLIVGLSMPAAARPVAAASSTATTVVDEFGPGRWVVAGGAATLSAAPAGSSGSDALHVSYDLSGGSLGLSPAVTRPDFGGLPRTVELDVNGDGSWNVLYLQLRDATGEIFHYKLGNLSFRGWKTLAVDPGRTAPAATLGGDGDHVVDLPVQAFKIVLDRNGTQPATSAIDLDRLAVTSEPWTPLRADSRVFVPSAGQSTTLRLGLVDPGDYHVVLTDEAGRVRTWAGTTAGGSDGTLRWNGRSDADALMTGSVQGRLTITRSAKDTIVDVPYLTALGVRLEPASPGSIVGVNSTLTTINTVDRAKAESQARLMENGFIRMARETFDWNRVETRKGWFEWAKFDQAVEIAAAHQVELLGMLAYSASWASSAPAGASSPAFYPPKSTADFAAYAKAVVHRYKDRVHTWEVWNEENSAIFWKSGVSAAGYAALLKATYAAIKAEDPTATVLLGGTVGFDRPFMDGIAAAGAWSSFDALAIHTYVAGQPETSMVVTWLDNARAYMAAKGAKPIWVTEFGWSTYTGSGTGYIGVSETRQA
ncbi:MAG: large repetitive protein, partial [Chloroflexota bacterium]|nr:large repetitive protein [Chloroflexota bacterium]